MTRPGPKPKPAYLRAIDEKAAAGAGHQGPKPKRRAPLKAPPEPRWSDLLPGHGSRTVRQDCHRVWERVVTELERLGAVSLLDADLLIDACICVARLRQCERYLSRLGLTHDTDRGLAKTPYTTIAAQYRSQLKFYVAELGLGPWSRSRLDLPGPDDNDLEDLLS